MPAGKPPDDVERPAIVRSLAGDEPTEPIWANGAGGLTFALGDPPTRYVKWQPPHHDVDLSAEIERLRWAVDHTAVPRVLDHGRDGSAAWLVTEALSGLGAVTDRWRAEPATAVRAIATGLRRLHTTVAVHDCPFSWSVEHRLGHLQPRFEERRTALADHPPIDDLVVCHGDACAPNTILDDEGTFLGLVDLGSLGIADRWADLAVASMSLAWNYGEGWEGLFFETYEIDPDPERVAYYRLLWDST